MSDTDRSRNSTPDDHEFVQHYLEVLTMPFRIAPRDTPYATHSLPLSKVCEAIEASTLSRNGSQTWRQVPAAVIPAVPLCPTAPSSSGSPATTESTVANDVDRWTRNQHYQAFHYFHPAVRSFLFGAAAIRQNHDANGPPVNDFLRWYRRNDVKRVRVNADGVRMTFDVLRCDLVLIQPDVAALQLELRMQGTCALRDLQRVRDAIRRAYPPYIDHWRDADNANLVHWTGGHFPQSVTLLGDNDEPLAGLASGLGDEPPTASDADAALRAFVDRVLCDGENHNLPKDAESPALAKHWEYLLGDWCKAKQLRLLAPSDDRLPSMAWIAVREPRAISKGDWARLAYADGPGSDVLPNAGSFIEQQFPKHAYDRFWYAPADSGDLPSRILNCGYAFTMVGSAADDFFFMNDRNGAFVAFRQIYVRMGLVAHLQKAALQGAVARLAALADREPDSGVLKPYHDETRSRDILAAYEEFLHFTQVYWFDEVSPQEQGVQLFSMWQAALRSQQYYDEVRQELKDLVEYANARHAELQARNTARLTRVAGVLGLIATVASVLGMNILPVDNGTVKASSWIDTDSCRQLGLSVVALVCCGGVFLAGWLSLFWDELVPRRLQRLRPVTMGATAIIVLGVIWWSWRHVVC